MFILVEHRFYPKRVILKTTLETSGKYKKTTLEASEEDHPRFQRPYCSDSSLQIWGFLTNTDQASPHLLHPFWSVISPKRGQNTFEQVDVLDPGGGPLVKLST